MTVTSVHLTQGGGTITAEGDMGEYGRAYLTYTLTADANGMGGTVVGEGRGAMQAGRSRRVLAPVPTTGMAPLSRCT